MNSVTSDLIEINPNKVSGTPVFAGRRVPIKNLFDYLEGGDVTREQAIAVLVLAEKSLMKELGAD